MDQRTDALQQLSAAMDLDDDGGSSHRHASNTDSLAKIMNDTELRGSWARYHMIGDAMRGQLPGRIDLELAAKVSAAIEAEPTVLATRRGVKMALKPLAGLAIAASVAALAVIGAQRIQTPVEINSQPPVAQQRFQTPVEPASISVVRWDDVSPAAVSRLNSYMVNYSEYRSNLGVPGILPYVRIVGSETE